MQIPTIMIRINNFNIHFPHKKSDPLIKELLHFDLQLSLELILERVVNS